MLNWILFNLHCLMLEQMGLFTPDEPDVKPPPEWYWATRQAEDSHWRRPWRNRYVVVNHYRRILEHPDDPDNDIPF